MNLTLKQNKHKSGTHRLLAKLKDATTERSLNGRTVRLFAKQKNSSTQKFIHKRVIKKGQANFSMPNRQAIMQYQIRFKPRRANDVETYGQTTSSRIPWSCS